MNFSLEQLNSFVAVYENGSFSEAAAKLEKHRTTIGQVITNLEDQLAVELFERVGRSAKPTHEGLLLYRYAKQTIDQANSFDKIALSLSFGHLEQVTIAYSSFLPDAVLVSIRMALSEEFPEMKVHFKVMSKDAIKQAIIDDLVQIGIVNVDTRSAMTSFDATFLTNISHSIYTAINDPLQQLPEEQRLSKIRSSKQIILDSYIQDGMSDKMIASPDYEVVSDLSLMLNLVREGLGWAMLPVVIAKQIEIDGHIKELPIHHIKEDFFIPVALWFPHSKPVLAIKKIVSNVLLKFIEENRIHRPGRISR